MTDILYNVCSKCAEVFPKSKTKCPVCGSSDSKPFSFVAKKVSKTSKSNEQQKSAGNKEINVIIIVVVLVVLLFLGRGPNGLICKYILPSVYTESERAFWKNLAGCDCEPTVVSSQESSTTVTEDINSKFRVAAGLGKLKEVTDLLNKGADVDSKGPGTEQVPAGGTALMLAAANNQQDVVRLLLSRGAKPNQADEGGGTALIYASWKGHLDIVRILLESGADVNATTRDGRTSLIVAKSSGHEEVGKLLQVYGAQK